MYESISPWLVQGVKPVLSSTQANYSRLARERNRSKWLTSVTQMGLP